MIFLSALGAGGISIIPFAFLQYTFEHGSGLIKRNDIDFTSLNLNGLVLHYGLDIVMLLFVSIHLILTVINFRGLWAFYRSENFDDFFKNPLKNTAILPPFISIIMTMNVMIGPVRYFIPEFADNLQLFMLPALLFWIVIYIALMLTEMKLLKVSFLYRVDINQISFGWLLHPFALGMLTVTGMGIAAMAKSSDIANTAAFLSLISGSMGMFLLVIKLFTVFHRYFLNEGLGEKELLPSFLIVIPNITLYAISLFRFGHYLEHQFGAHLDAYFIIVVGGLFAFETWYMLFGMMLLIDYFKKDFFKKEYYVTQWGLICPFVAYAVLASFTYHSFLNSFIFYGLSLIFMGISIILFFNLLFRYMKCSKKDLSLSCSY